jgi:histidinol dehydrogenase
VISFTKAGLESVADDVRRLAEKEGLTAHAASVDVRLHDDSTPPVTTTSKSSQAHFQK